MRGWNDIDFFRRGRWKGGENATPWPHDTGQNKNVQCIAETINPVVGVNVRENCPEISVVLNYSKYRIFERDITHSDRSELCAILIA
jgi:hypothetical protein